MRECDAEILAGTTLVHQSTGLRTVQVECPPFPPVNAGYDEWSAILDEAQMADQRGIDNRMNGLLIVVSSIGYSIQSGMFLNLVISHQRESN
jgi:hypothetical protein